MDIAPVHIRRFPSLRCHRFHRVHKKKYKRRQEASESESELFTGDASKDNHSSGPVIMGVIP